jgi:hypothetical protein
VRNELVSYNPARYPVPDQTWSMGLGKIRRVGPGTNMIAYSDPDQDR